MAGLQGLDRDDAVVDEYQSSVRQFGGFRYVCSAIVLHSERNRTHFHLIYATRHRKGVEVFKEAERKAMEVQEAARARAQDRSRRESNGMLSLFGAEEMHSSVHYELLRGPVRGTIASDGPGASSRQGGAFFTTTCGTWHSLSP